MDGLTFSKNPYLVPAVVLGVSLVIGVIIGATTFTHVKSFDNTLSVTGSAKQSVVADSVKWTSSVSRTVTEGTMEDGYTSLKQDIAAVFAFLKTHGIVDGEIITSPVYTEQIYKYNQNGAEGPREYTLRQTITVQSKNVSAVGDLTKNTGDIIAKGVLFSTQNVEYFYSKLADLRVSLLSDAVKDAKARAEKLAESSGQRVGVLKSASSGVVQVLAPNSIEVSDYGQYDTQSVDKDVMVTVRATFVVD